MKAAEALKAAIKKNRKCPKSKRCSIRLTANSFNIWFDRQEASILTTNGRIKCGFYMPDWFRQYLSWRRRQAELVKTRKGLFLCIVWQKEIPDIQIGENPHILGVDRGVNKVAVCSDNTFYNGYILKVANRYHRLRRQLQSKGTKSAKRHLRKISQKENRFRRDVNHCIAKQIVASVPPGGVIVLENLKHIKKRMKGSRRLLRKLHSWSFYELEQFIRYKAEAKGVMVDYVDARYTSQKCSKCGHIERGNRQYQSGFKCKRCGFSLNADLNAARNIELNYRDAKGYPEGLSVNQPIVATGFSR
jgi:IS605 OrfB family transposase